MFRLISQWRRQRLLSRFDADSRARWQRVLDSLPIFDGLAPDAQTRLMEMGWCFLHHKRFTPVMDTELTAEHCIEIALMAALPILNLDLTHYGSFHELLIYPEGFLSPRHYVDDNGVEHQGLEELAGEAWEQGPVILSLSELAYSGDWSGFNLVIHELAHKLDMANGGVANGYPDLPVELRPQWLTVFPRDFDRQRRLVQEAEAHAENADEKSADAQPPWQRLWIDPYAAENEAEFFAVCLEAFFTDPIALQLAFPDLYRLLKRYLRQDPIDRAPQWLPLRDAPAS